MYEIITMIAVILIPLAPLTPISKENEKVVDKSKKLCYNKYRIKKGRGKRER